MANCERVRNCLNMGAGTRVRPAQAAAGNSAAASAARSAAFSGAGAIRFPMPFLACSLLAIRGEQALFGAVGAALMNWHRLVAVISEVLTRRCFTGCMMISDPFFIAAVALVVGSTLVCAALLTGAFRRRALAWPSREEPLMHALEPFVPGRAPFSGARIDVDGEIWAVLEDLAAEASDRFVAVDVAITPNLSVHTDRDVLRTLVHLLAGHAIRQAREQVLVSGVRRGGRVQIAVTDDGSAATQAEQQALLRPAAELAALQGGTFEITTWPGQGTTVAVRLPAPVESRHPAEQGRTSWQSVEHDRELATEAAWEI